MSKINTSKIKYSKEKIRIITALIALLGVLLTGLFINWDKIFFNRSEQKYKYKEYSFFYSGRVLEKKNKKPVKDANVSLRCFFRINPKRTDSNGMFYFEFKRPEDHFQAEILITHANYVELSEYRTINQYSEPEDFFLDPIPIIEKNKTKKNLNGNIIMSPESKKKDLNVSGKMEFQISGYVSDTKGNVLPDAEIFVNSKAITFSTKKGYFCLSFKNEKDIRILLRARKTGYKPWSGYITPPNDNVIIHLEEE